MNENSSISLGSYLEDFVRNEISQGRYRNAGEVIRAGLRLLKNEENHIGRLQDAIQEGLDSGIADDFNPKEHLYVLKMKRINAEVSTH